jgi:hypothetical protein
MNEEISNHIHKEKEVKGNGYSPLSIQHYYVFTGLWEYIFLCCFDNGLISGIQWESYIVEMLGF